MDVEYSFGAICLFADDEFEKSRVEESVEEKLVLCAVVIYMTIDETWEMGRTLEMRLAS